MFHLVDLPIKNYTNRATVNRKDGVTHLVLVANLELFIRSISINNLMKKISMKK